MWSARQQHCLQGMGIRLWRERGAAPLAGEPLPGDRAGAVLAEADGVGAAARAAQSPAVATPPVDAPSPPSPPAESPAAAAAEAAPETPPTAPRPAPADLRLDDWDSVNRAIHACTACALAESCTQKVPGVGSPDADLMIVGEGPGHDEDIRGEPFVGRSGQLLDRMLAAIGMAREQVFITNIVKCRPPNNRDPKAEEAASCRVYLDAQIRLVAPKIILSVGRISAHNLLDCNDAVGKLIKQMHRLPGSDLPVKVTYHPAYLLRNPPAKSIAWDDLKQVHRLLS